MTQYTKTDFPVHGIHRRRLLAGWAGFCVLLAASCEVRPPAGRDAPVPPVATQRADLIDAGIPPAVAGEDGWNYQQSVRAHLTGDTVAERVVLTARVELYRGRPAWDDGQPWQVYVEAADGARTYLYAQRLQLGTLQMRVAFGEQGEPASVVLVEHLPDRLSVYEAFYRSPGRVDVMQRFQRSLDPRGDVASPHFP